MEEVLETFLNVLASSQRAFPCSNGRIQRPRDGTPTFRFRGPESGTKGPQVPVPLPFRSAVLNNARAQRNVSPISKARLLAKHPRPTPPARTK